MQTPAGKLLYHGRHFQVVGGAVFRSFRCLWMLEELGIPYEHVRAMPQSRKIKAYHPLGKVPALIETTPSDDPTNTEENPSKPFVMYESAAINTYLGDFVNTIGNGDPARLVPLVGTHERGLYEQTVSCIMTELDSQGLWIHRKHETMGEYFGHIPAAVSHAKRHFELVNAALAKQLHNNINHIDASSPRDSVCNFLVGSQFTAADILYVHCLDWSQAIGWDKGWKKDTKLCAYFDICKARPAFQRVAAIRAKEQQDMKRKSKL